MKGPLPSLAAVTLTVAALFTAADNVRAEPRPIDVEHSTLTVFVYKSGLFSAFADNHVISAPIAAGSISEESPLAIDVMVRSSALRVLDPGLSSDRRAEVQARMLGAEVLDVAMFPDITFASTTVEPAGADRWNATGRLTIHGQARVIMLPVVRANGRYRGEVVIKLRDFGIEPITVAGGAVKVKDELKVQFEIVR